MKIAIADDIQEVRTKVQEQIRDYMDQHGIPAEIFLFETPQSFIESLAQETYSVVIMDVYFRGETLTGVDAVRTLRERDRRCHIIFLTDSSDHMSDAFSVHAFSYILKTDLDQMLPQALDDLITTVSVNRSITLNSGKSAYQMAISDIISIQTEGHYLRIRDINQEEYRIRMTLSQITKKLEKAPEFLTVNKGILVNMDHIRDFDGYIVIMTDGSRLPVRIRGYASIVRSWHDYNFDKLRADRI